MNGLKLGTKFNALLMLILLLGTLISGLALSTAMQNRAEAEITARAEILTQTMNAARSYTSKNIQPLLRDRLATDPEFIPETVPAYSAREIFETFRQRPEYQNFFYKEATLNPTNPRDQADPFETGLVQEFRQNPTRQEKVGYYNRQGEKLFYIARPLSIKKQSCLQCHGNPADAPPSMINTYGANNGFNWQLNEIVAAQTIYIPASQVLQQGQQYWYLAIAIFMAIFSLVMVAINLLLGRAVIQPLKKLTRLTQSWHNPDETTLAAGISTQAISVIAHRQDEPGQLARAFQHLNLELAAREAKLQQAQAELKQSEIYFRSLIEQASDVLFILDSQHIITYASPSAATIFGYQLQAMIDRNLLDFILEELHFSVTDFLAIAGQNYGITMPIELSFRHQDGSWLAVEAIANNLLHDEVVNGIVLNLRDITEREQVDQRLRLLESVVVNANDAIVITEAQSLAAPEHPKIIYVNKAFAEITGYTSGEVIGKTPRMFQGEKTDRHTLNQIKQSLLRYLPVKTEIINYGKNNQEYWVELNIVPIADRKGNYTHFVAVERDITERKQAEQELRDREAAIKNLYQLTARQDLSFTKRVQKILELGCRHFDLELGILSKVNQDIYQIVTVVSRESQLKIARGDLYSLEQTCCQIVREQSQPHYFNNVISEHPCYLDQPIAAFIGTKVLVNGKIYGTLDFSRIKPQDTAFKPLQIEFIQLMAEWIGREIERRKSRSKLSQARDEAEAANKAKSEFLATMSHEIRTPMNAVIGMTGLLLNTKLNAQQQDFVSTIRNSGDALLTLINDILDFSKIEAGKLEFEQQPFQLNSCIESALNLVATKAEEKQLELAYLIEPDTPNYILGDITRLRQILVNLLSNAVKFTEAGEVTIRVKAEPETLPLASEDSDIFMTQAHTDQYQIEFAVQDTGIGIPSDRLNRLFKSFSQVDASTTRQYGGTGLGLAISKKLAEMMGGAMWVTSEVGVGSIFYFKIAANVVEKDQEPTQHRLIDKKMLIVDNNATNRQILQLQAKSWQAHSYIAETGTEALEIIIRGTPLDLAILDMQMPGMDGLTLARAIRRQPGYEQLPLVMLSSLSKQEIIPQAQELNFAAIVNKPIPQSQLYQILVQAIASKLVKVKSTNTSCLTSKLAEQLPLNILLAEDIVVNQKVALLILQQMGYRVDVASNGIEVLEALRRQPYDVVLMDLQMPEMDGLTATKLIYQEFSAEVRPRIIAMTANAMTGDRENCLAAGMDDYVSKPIRVEELQEALLKSQKASSPVLETVSGAKNLAADISLDKSLAHAAIDSRVLESICDMAGAEANLIIAEMINSYLADTQQRLQAIAKAIAEADLATIYQAAHSLKSSSANLGANNLAQLCEDLEQLGREQIIAGTQPLLSDAESEFIQVERELQYFLAALN